MTDWDESRNSGDFDISGTEEESEQDLQGVVAAEQRPVYYSPGKKRSFFLRIIHYPPLRLIIAFILVGGTMFAFGVLFYIAHTLTFVKDLGPEDFLFSITLVLAVHPVYWLYVRLIERRYPTEISFRSFAPDLFYGLIIGVGIFSVMMGFFRVLGYYHVESYNQLTVLLPVISLSLYSGYCEEVVSRLIIFRILEEWLGTWSALLLSALFFGIVHLGNENASMLSSLAITLEAGILLGAAYILTRSVWLAVGIHFAWNFSQGGIFGMPVSGVTVKGFVNARLDGPTWFTGGEFGPEGSAVAVIIGGIIGLVFLVLASKKGHIISLNKHAYLGRIQPSEYALLFQKRSQHVSTIEYHS